MKMNSNGNYYSKLKISYATEVYFTERGEEKDYRIEKMYISMRKNYFGDLYCTTYRDWVLNGRQKYIVENIWANCTALSHDLYDYYYHLHTYSNNNIR